MAVRASPAASSVDVVYQQKYTRCYTIECGWLLCVRELSQCMRLDLESTDGHYSPRDTHAMH